MLLRVVDAMRKGRSVTVSPNSQTPTTPQSAHLLGISRPSLIKALDDGQAIIPASDTAEPSRNIIRRPGTSALARRDYEPASRPSLSRSDRASASIFARRASVFFRCCSSSFMPVFFWFVRGTSQPIR